MLGTIVNTVTILAGSSIGSLCGKGIGERYRTVMFDALGLACLVLGLNSSLPNLNKSEFPVLFILSLVIGGVIGTKLDLAGRIERLNARINARNNNQQNSIFGLITGLLLFCIGTFSIVGPVLSCLSPSGGWEFSESANTFLYTNATLDFVSSAVLAASYGWIMLLAAPVLFLWQGMFYAIAYYFGEGMPEQMRIELSIVGGALIVSSGLGILGIKDCKTVNLLPSLIVPVIFYLFKSYVF